MINRVRNNIQFKKTYGYVKDYTYNLYPKVRQRLTLI